MHTQVEFRAKYFGMMTVRGYFNAVTTRGHVDPVRPADSSVEVSIVASLTTNNAHRDNDLRSPYFLELDKYPTIMFSSTRIEPKNEGEFKLTGDPTIKGITELVTLQVHRYGEINDQAMGTGSPIAPKANLTVRTSAWSRHARRQQADRGPRDRNLGRARRKERSLARPARGCGRGRVTRSSRRHDV